MKKRRTRKHKTKLTHKQKENSQVEDSCTGEGEWRDD